MITPETTPQIFRGLLQTADGLITRVSESNGRQIRFQAAFSLSDRLIECIRHQPQDVIFSERSRIARLGVQIKGPPLTAACLDGRTAVLDLTATQVIAGYPGLDLLRDFFTAGLPVGRLVYCDPDALMTSDQVLAAIEDSALKLPASTSISSDGSIVISPPPGGLRAEGAHRPGGAGAHPDQGQRPRNFRPPPGPAAGERPQNPGR